MRDATRDLNAAREQALTPSQNDREIRSRKIRGSRSDHSKRTPRIQQAARMREQQITATNSKDQQNGRAAEWTIGQCRQPANAATNTRTARQQAGRQAEQGAANAQRPEGQQNKLEKQQTDSRSRTPEQSRMPSKPTENSRQGSQNPGKQNAQPAGRQATGQTTPAESEWNSQKAAKSEQVRIRQSKNQQASGKQDPQNKAATAADPASKYAKASSPCFKAAEGRRPTPAGDGQARADGRHFRGHRRTGEDPPGSGKARKASSAKPTRTTLARRTMS